MGKIEDILHAFLDGETDDSQELALIHALLARPQLREQFVKECRIHHATLYAHSAEQAAEFKERLDLFCRRWEAAGSTRASDIRSAFGAGAVTTGIAAVFLIGVGVFVYQGSQPDVERSVGQGPVMAHEIVTPVRQLTLVRPANDLYGEPLSVTFSVAQVTSEELKAPEEPLENAYPELSDTFSQAYIRLLRDERKQGESILSEGIGDLEGELNDPFAFELSNLESVGSDPTVTFSFESVDTSAGR